MFILSYRSAQTRLFVSIPFAIYHCTTKETPARIKLWELYLEREDKIQATDYINNSYAYWQLAVEYNNIKNGHGKAINYCDTGISYLSESKNNTTRKTMIFKSLYMERGISQIILIVSII